MLIIRIIQKPLVKTIGIVAILYFALFANKENPESLGNRLSPDIVKKNLGEAFQKSQFVVSNISSTKAEIAKLEGDKKERMKLAKATIKDIKVGGGEGVAECGDRAEIIYKISTQDGASFPESKKSLTIGSEESPMLEKNIIGMKVEGVRVINISRDFKGTDYDVKELIGRYQSDLVYEVTMFNFSKNPEPPTFCN